VSYLKPGLQRIQVVTAPLSEHNPQLRAHEVQVPSLAFKTKPGLHSVHVPGAALVQVLQESWVHLKQSLPVPSARGEKGGKQVMH